MERVFKRIGGIIIVMMIALAAFIAGTMVMSSRAQQPVNWTAQIEPTQIVPGDATESEQRFAQIYSRVSPSVVSINVVTSAGDTRGFNDGFAAGTGTGFVLDQQGNIVTNAHVVEDAVSIEVNFFDGRIVRGDIVGIDLDSDIAVIRVDEPAESLQPLALGDSDALFIGQSVVAIGSPFGQRWTMTTGIVSALDRTIQGLTNFSIGSVIQTDAAINPGNSGGPLLNLDGEVIGVNAQIISESRSNSGIGFAIPANLVARVAQSLITRGEVDYSYLGISGVSVSLDLIEALDLPNYAQGVVVARVERGAPADDAGLREPNGGRTLNGVNVPTRVDIITAIDGTPVSNMDDLIAYLAENTQPGQNVSLTVIRDGREEVMLNVVLEARPE
jgi:2-alkenal reductase